MKNLLYELKKSSQNKFVQNKKIESLDCLPNGKANTLAVLNLVEDLQIEAHNTLKKIAPKYQKAIQRAAVQFYENAQAGDQLLADAKFYSIDRTSVALKVFVKKKMPNKRTKRVCRATYYFKAELLEKAA